MNPTIYRAPDGHHWYLYGHNHGTGLSDIRPAIQDPATRRWGPDPDSLSRRIARAELDTWTVLPPEPLADPRITRLTALLEPVLAGLPPEQATEIRDALAAIRAMPDELRHQKTDAYRMGRRSRS